MGLINEQELRAEPSGQKSAFGQLMRGALAGWNGRIGLGIVALLVLIAVVGPFVTPVSPYKTIGAPFSPPSGSAVLGTDELGRDVLSRVLAGGWVLLIMAVIATVVGVLIGAIAGITAAYFKGAVDNVIMRAVDVLLSFPQLVFALLLVSIAGSQLWLIVLAVAVSHAPQSARIVRGAALDVTERDFVKSAEVLGLSRLHIMLKEILPNLVSPLLVEAGLRFTFSIIIIAGLAFLGFGQPPPAANWGVMINENRAGISANPWSVIVPAALIAALTVGMNTLADAITRSATRGTVVEPIARSAKA